jgi:hypothetical protein
MVSGISHPAQVKKLTPSYALNYRALDALAFYTQMGIMMKWIQSQAAALDRCGKAGPAGNA